MAIQLNQPEVIEATEVQVVRTVINTPPNNDAPISVQVVYVKGYRDANGKFIQVGNPQVATFIEWRYDASGQKVIDQDVQSILQQNYNAVKNNLVYALLQAKNIIQGTFQ